MTPLALALALLGVHKQPKMTLNPHNNLGIERKSWDAEQQDKYPKKVPENDPKTA